MTRRDCEELFSKRAPSRRDYGFVMAEILLIVESVSPRVHAFITDKLCFKLRVIAKVMHFTRTKEVFLKFKLPETHFELKIISHK